MNETLKTLLERRSVRSYRPDPVDEAALEAILKAGMYAPTAMGKQSPVLVAVTRKETRDLLSRLNARVLNSDGDPFYGAPVVVAVLADRAKTGCYLEDGSLAIGNMANAAFSLGVDSCWIHRAKEVFASEEGQALLREWGLEGDYVGVGHLILGYRAGELPAPKPRKANYAIRVK